MICKSVFLFALVAVTQAQYGGLGGYGHGHGHAVSSQSIVKHETPIHHKQPVLLAVQSHHAPIHAPVKGHAVSSQSFVSHHTPVHHAPVHHAPIHVPVHHVPVHHVPVHHVPVHHVPVHHVPIHKHEEEYSHPAYKFEYSVHDDHTKDIKSQSEHRDGDVVEGEYSLLQPDGHVRNVKYHADKHSGFNAQVTYSHPGHGHHQGY